MSVAGSEVGQGQDESLLAGESFASLQYTWVYISADNTVKSCTSGLPYGIIQNNPASGEAATVRISGTSKLVASAAIVVDAKVGATTGGKGVSKSSDKDAYGGIAIQAAAADADEILVKIAPAYLAV